MLVIFNLSFTFSYWANSINGSSNISSSNVTIGDWPFVPEDALAGIGDEASGSIITIDMIGSSEFPEYPADGVYVFVADIVIDETFVPQETFTGVIDGQGHTVSYDLSVNDVNNMGLFSNNTGTIKNLVVDGGTLETDLTNDSQIVGLIVGTNNGIIDNVIVNNGVIIIDVNITDLTSNRYIKAGGIAGINGVNGVITNSHVDATITATIIASGPGNGFAAIDSGGLVGLNEGRIENSTTSGNFTATNTYNGLTNNYFALGGLVGDNAASAQLINVSSSMNINAIVNGSGVSAAAGPNVGGLIGVLRPDAFTIDNLFASGNVVVTSTREGGGNSAAAGGLIGHVSSGNLITNSYATGDVSVNTNNSISGTLSSYSGGLIGNLEASVLSSSYSTGNISAVADHSATGSATAYAGGLVAHTNGTGTTVSSSYSTGAVTTNATSRSAELALSGSGGLIGLHQGSVNTSYASGQVESNAINTSTGAATAYSGGLVANATSTGDRIITSYVEQSPTITAETTTTSGASTSYSGGLVGFSASSIRESNTNANAAGTSTATSGGSTSYVGGLVGQNLGTLNITTALGNSTATTTTVSGASQAFSGGLAGENNASISNSSADGIVLADAKTTTTSTATTATAISYAGGLVGNLGASSNISLTHASGSTISQAITAGRSTATSYSGGLIGKSLSSIANSNSDAVVSSIANTTLSGTSRTAIATAYAGGLVSFTNQSINESYATGSVAVSTLANSQVFANSFAGGLVGVTSAPVNNTYATGSINGTATVIQSNNRAKAYNYVGGLIGQSNGSAVSNSYAKGNVTGNSSATTSARRLVYAGGVVGNSVSTGYTLTFGYGNVTSSGNGVLSTVSYAGGFVGLRSGTTINANNRRFSGQVITRNSASLNSEATSSTTALLQTMVNGWSAIYWNKGNITGNVFPTLINGGPQS